MTFNIIYDDYRVALYEDGHLLDFAKHDYLDVETLVNVIPLLLPGAEVIHTYAHICDVLDGNEPPLMLNDLMEMLNATTV